MMASRRKGRILAFQALYCWESNRLPIEDLMDFSWLESDKRENLDSDMAVFSRALIAGTIENIKAVDGMIRKHLQNWDFSRLNRVDLAVLRMSVYTLMFQRDMPPSIVINEAIGIAREFGTDDSFRFINGVLDSIRKTLQAAATPCPS
ncbi:MAG TPA: transcription antitermination factor NusB [Treponema sp.]|nr:transcription antitermination factor NusB [Treponema sp.]